MTGVRGGRFASSGLCPFDPLSVGVMVSLVVLIVVATPTFEEGGKGNETAVSVGTKPIAMMESLFKVRSSPSPGSTRRKTSC